MAYYKQARGWPMANNMSIFAAAICLPFGHELGERAALAQMQGKGFAIYNGGAAQPCELRRKNGLKMDIQTAATWQFYINIGRACAKANNPRSALFQANQRFRNIRPIMTQ
jgi:hypothetical protein